MNGNQISGLQQRVTEYSRGKSEAPEEVVNTTGHLKPHVAKKGASQNT